LEQSERNLCRVSVPISLLNETCRFLSSAVWFWTRCTKGYKDSWRCHIKSRVKGRVRDFRTVDGESLMIGIETANKTETDDLAHGTYKHIKVTLSSMFTFAKRKGIYDA
jgi:hypothetical protein